MDPEPHRIILTGAMRVQSAMLSQQSIQLRVMRTIETIIASEAALRRIRATFPITCDE
jgi:hypothetical protein